MYIQVDLDILDVTNDHGKIAVNVWLKNSSTKAVKLPQRSYQDLFTCSLKPVNSGAHVANLEISCRKTTKIDNLELIEVEPNKSVEYKVELDSFFILNTLKLVSGSVVCIFCAWGSQDYFLASRKLLGQILCKKNCY